MNLYATELLLGFLLVLPLTISLIFWLNAARLRLNVPLLLPRSDPIPPRSARLFASGCVLFVLRIALQQSALVNLAGPRPDAFDPNYYLVVARLLVVVDLFVIGIGCGIVASLPVEVRKGVGFRRDDLAGQLRTGGLGFIAALFPVAVCLLAIAPFKTPDNQHTMLKVLKEVSDIESLLTVVVLATITAPIVEELFYRVFLQQGLIVAGSLPRVVIPTVAVFFCLNHTFPDLIPLFPLAMMLGLVFHLRNSFLACVVMHVLFNAYNIVVMFAAPGE